MLLAVHDIEREKVFRGNDIHDRIVFSAWVMGFPRRAINTELESIFKNHLNFPWTSCFPACPLIIEVKYIDIRATTDSMT